LKKFATFKTTERKRENRLISEIPNLWGKLEKFHQRENN
jgi:hypothetical protein